MKYRQISVLHYITPNLDHQDDYLKDISNACQNGVEWVQLRMKNYPKDLVLSTGMQAKKICDHFNAKLIINDYPEIANYVGAYGVHVGKEDEAVVEIKKRYGNKLKIGATANTFEDIEAAAPFVDYIGLGPLRFTATKEKLSPVLGLEGYREIIEKCTNQGIDLPVIGIGGIRLEDMDDLKKTGLHGVAVSGLIYQSSHNQDTIQQIKNKFAYVEYSQ
ncbi:thiamine phosphate synthase [Echinicola jeungdonensis]|uniref:Thiamine-phosphate synthase n=1 Tax=Echinicola jeungdonensis TaxID=709343 RepID=A0ABV5J5V3_9BACT|nr:thiamine phosphate synthase [Echinicola jeungdonensis]MDN3670863.1 thiamine phosphate synthase [Echinicola jeungdonensis]